MSPLVTFVLHKFSRGGSDRVAAYLAKGFVAAGFRVELIVFARGGEVEQVLLDLLGDVPVRFIGKAGRWRTADLLSGLVGFVKYLRNAQPDVVLSTANNTALVSAIGCKLASLRKARLVLKTTNPIATSRHRGWVRRLRLWSYRLVFAHTAAVWTLSDDESAEMRAQFPQFTNLFEAVVQPYVTPAMERTPDVEARSQDPVILSIARLTRQKRLDRLIEAFAHVRTKNARLVILGEGEDRETLAGLIHKLGLSARVDMPGYLPNVTVALHQADLFVLTSDYEGLPAAVIEAMAANCPVLSTDCFPSARSLLEKSEACEIIEDPAPAVLGEQIDRALLRKRPKELSQVARRYSVENGIQSHVRALGLVLECPAMDQPAA
jgi:glycosyltransferase involved in cell wall biosynthesis